MIKIKKRRAFTLVEVLLVIAVISILFIVLVSKVDFTTDKSKETGVKNDFRTLQIALKTVGIENAEFTDDIERLAEQLNVILTGDSSIIIDGNQMITNNKDPWGNHYELNYQKPNNTAGSVTMGSAGPDGIFGTTDDIKSTVTVEKDENGSHIVIDGSSNDTILNDNHSCVFDKQVKTSRYIAFDGNCITPIVYYFSCECGTKGTATFYGDVNKSKHSEFTTITYDAYSDYHIKKEECQDCHDNISSVSENHNVVNGKCSNCGQSIHEHIYNQETTNYIAENATCNSKAKYYYSCTCGEKGTLTFEYGNKLEHQYSSTNVRPATCEQTGLRRSTCDFCGVSTETTLSKLDHSFANRVNVSYKVENGDATCKSGTIYYKSCTMCGTTTNETFESGEFDYNNHVGTISVRYEKNNTLEHKVIQICNACDRENGIILSEEHNEVDGTCTKCENHNHYFELTNTDDKFKAIDATCQEKAQYYYSCICGEKGTLTFEYGNTKDHDISDIANEQYLKTEATCEDKSVYYKSCSMCGLQHEDVFTHGSALGHDEQVIKGISATCTTTGLTDGITCARCDKTIQTPTIINAYGHTELITKGVEATCTTSGMSDYIECSVCNTVLQTATIIESLGHDMINEPNVVPTCTTNGYKNGQHCSRCDYIIAQEIIPAVGHIEITNESTLPTCTKPGLNGGTVCETCGVYLVNPEIIPELGHSVVIQHGSQPTCTQSGWGDSEVCSTCNVVVKSGELLPALGHNEVIDEGFAATCTKEGLTAGSHCSVCNEVLQGSSIVEKIPHNYIVAYIDNPSCTTVGIMHYKCVECNHEYQETIDMIAHVDNNFDMVCDICNQRMGSLEEIIEFSVDGWSYRVPTGYTWNDFINSNYNIKNYSVLGGDTGFVASALLYCIADPYGYHVVCSDKILSMAYISIMTSTNPSDVETRELVGTWDYNERLSRPTDDMFKTYDITHVVFFKIYNQYTFVDNIDSFQIFEDDELLYDSALENPWGTSTGASMKLASFHASSPGTVVPKEFYEWFIQNAKPRSYTLSGDWILNENVTLPKSLITYSDISFMHGSYLTSYNNYSYFYGTYKELSVGNSYDSRIIISTDGTFANIQDRYFSFGNGTVLGKDLYEWFVQNAVPDNRIVTGSWQFNELIYKHHLDHYINIKFESNNKQFERINISQSGTTNITTKMVFGTGWGTTAYQQSSNTIQDTYWKDENWRSFTILDNAIMSRSEYEWLLLNAKQISSNNSCEHEYSVIIINHPDCITPGTQVKTCSICGYKEYESIAMTGHVNLVTIDAVESTCLEGGYTASITCLDCGLEVQKSQTTKALGHDYQLIKVIEGSCTSSSLKYYQCSRCPQELVEVDLPLGHLDENNDGICERCQEGTNCFYIIDTKYNFTPGMTFAEWCDSENNVDGWVCVDNYYVMRYDHNVQKLWWVYSDGTILPNDTIVNDKWYDAMEITDAMRCAVTNTGKIVQYTEDSNVDVISDEIQAGNILAYCAYNRFVVDANDVYKNIEVCSYVDNTMVRSKILKYSTLSPTFLLEMMEGLLKPEIQRCILVDSLGNEMEMEFNDLSITVVHDYYKDNYVLKVYAIAVGINDVLRQDITGDPLVGSFPIYFNGVYNGQAISDGESIMCTIDKCGVYTIKTECYDYILWYNESEGCFEVKTPFLHLDLKVDNVSANTTYKVYDIDGNLVYEGISSSSGQIEINWIREGIAYEIFYAYYTYPRIYIYDHLELPYTVMDHNPGSFYHPVSGYYTLEDFVTDWNERYEQIKEIENSQNK